MVLTDYKLPCLQCGRLLQGDDDVITCPCGVSYDKKFLDDSRRPGYHREWLAAFACTCGRVERNGESITITRHRCRTGGIGMLDRSN